MLIFHGGLGPDSSPEEMQANMNQWMGWVDQLAKAGIYASGEALHPGGKLVNGSVSNVTDGPFTEGKEVVGGYFIINAENYEAAVAACAGYPDFDKGGSVQVRQVVKFDM